MLFKNNRAFSLVELMVTIGLLGGLSLIVMNLTKESTKSSTKYQFDSEIILITNEINGILSDPNKCITTFTNATQATPPATPVLNVTPANITSPIGIAGIPSTIKKYTIAGGPYGNGGVKISSYFLDLTATPDSLLTINFQKKSILGSGTVSKTIKLYVEKNASGVITKCRALSTSTTDIWTRGSATDANNIYYNGGVRAGDETQTNTCDSTTEGTQRYNKTTHSMQYCGYNAGPPVTYAWTSMGGATPGEYSFFDTATCPSGWVIANGSNATVDLRGEFIRVWDNGRGADAGRTIGSWQEASVLAQTANYGGNIQWDWTGDPIAPRFGTYNKYENNNTASYANTGYNGSWRSRPRNIALLACKKL